MANDDDIVLLACAMAVAAAASAVKDELLDDDQSDVRPQLRFVRPETSYLDYLDMQRDLLHDRGDRVIYDTFRMNGTSLDALVKMAAPYLRGRVNPRDVVCVVVHWLATGASVRAQEQFFLDKGFSTLHHYRTIGLVAILRGLTANGFYGEDINDPERIAASRAAFAAKEPSLGACIGAIDGTHIPVVVPAPLSERYRNR